MGNEGNPPHLAALTRKNTLLQLSGRPIKSGFCGKFIFKMVGFCVGDPVGNAVLGTKVGVEVGGAVG